MNSEMGISSKLRRLTTPVKCLTDNPRGARHWAHTSRHKLVCGRSVRILTHDAVMRIGGKAPGRRAHSRRRHLCHVSCRFPPPRIVNRQSALNASASAE